MRKHLVKQDMTFFIIKFMQNKSLNSLIDYWVHAVT
jgi:hypothetical protein